MRPEAVFPVESLRLCALRLAGFCGGGRCCRCCGVGRFGALQEVAEEIVFLQDVIDQPGFYELHGVHLEVQAFVLVGLLKFENSFDHYVVNGFVLLEFCIACSGHDVFFVPEMPFGIDDQLIQDLGDIMRGMLFCPEGMEIID